MFTIPTEYYPGINFPTEFNLRKYLSLKQIISCDLLENLTLSRRIGSDSLHAKVYSGKIHNHVVAVKILKKLEQLSNEIYINELIFSDPSNNFYFLYLISGLECIITKENKNESKGILVMEIAISDINQRIKFSDISPQDFDHVISDVLQSLLRLAYLSIYHADLHLGNVFLVTRNGEVRAVIGDFGESTITDSPTASSSDLFQFLRALREKISSSSYLSRLNTFYSKIGERSRSLEDEFDTYLEIMNEKEAVIKCNVKYIEDCIHIWSEISGNCI